LQLLLPCEEVHKGRVSLFMEAFCDEEISIDDVVDSTILELQLGGGLDDWKDLDPFLDSPIKVQQEQRWKKVLFLDEQPEPEEI